VVQFPRKAMLYLGSLRLRNGCFNFQYWGKKEAHMALKLQL